MQRITVTVPGFSIQEQAVLSAPFVLPRVEVQSCHLADLVSALFTFFWTGTVSVVVAVSVSVEVWVLSNKVSELGSANVEKPASLRTQL